MAYAHGTANGHIDLWNKFLSFITTNADLVAADEAWEIAWTASTAQADGVVLKGPGASGLDSIYVSLKRFDAPATDMSYFEIRGMTGILAGAADVNSHINQSPIARSFFDVNAMEYWFVANGRRFIILAKMSTVYSILYGGFFLPYANPLAYPYPLLIGASSPDWLSGTNNINNWRSQSTYHRHFMFGYINTETGANLSHRASGYMLDPSGDWLNIGDTSGSANIAMAPWGFYQYDNYDSSDWRSTWNHDYSWDQLGYNDMRSRIEENVGGGYSLAPFTMIQTKPNIQTYGILDDLYCAPGENNAVENTVTIDGVDHLIVQNVFRTDVNQYSALRLE